MVSLTDKPKQPKHMHDGSHQSKNDHKDTGRPAKRKPGLPKIKTGGSIYVKMPKLMMAITISDVGVSNEAKEQELKQQLKEKQPVVETDDDDEDQKDDSVLHISQETVDGYQVSMIGHLEEYN